MSEPQRTPTHTVMDGELEQQLSELTRKQELFCREYFVDLNATQAAKRAGYKGNPGTLGSVGAENLTKPAIIGVMDLFFERKTSDIEINAGVIEREYWKLYQVSLNEGDRAVARACLKDLGEHHAMFVKVVATAEASELALRLTKGRTRMNARQIRQEGGDPAPTALIEGELAD